MFRNPILKRFAARRKFRNAVRKVVRVNKARKAHYKWQFKYGKGKAFYPIRKYKHRLFN